MSISRAERRSEAAKRKSRIDPACPPELIREIDVKLATTMVGKPLRFYPGDTVQTVMLAQVPDIFTMAAEQGFALSFDLPECTPEALSRGVIAYSIKRSTLN